jgi:hypothetical protein
MNPRPTKSAVYHTSYNRTAPELQAAKQFGKRRNSMARLATRATVRTLAISLVLALVVGSALALHGRAAPARAQQVAPSDRAAVVSAFFSAINNGDADGAAALFAGNAVFIGASPPCLAAAPCTDSAGIHQQLTGLVSGHECYVLRSISVSGAVVTGQREVRDDGRRSHGIDHTLTDFIALVPAGQITFWANLSDVADPQTALNAAITAGTQPAGTPIPNPETPCAGVSGA